MEQMIWIYVGMALLFVSLIALSMDISCVRHRNRELADEIDDLKHTIWGDVDTDNVLEDEAVGLYYSHKNLQNRVLELEIPPKALEPKVKKPQKKPLAKKR